MLNFLVILFIVLLESFSPVQAGPSCCPDGNSIVTTFAGKGIGNDSYNGENVPALSAQMDAYSVALDKAGNVYFADNINNRIGKISGGLVTTYAGNGTAADTGDGGPATLAGVNDPVFIAFDSKDNLYISGLLSGSIRKVAPNGIITTFAGTGTPGYSGDGGPATSAQVTTFDLAVDQFDNVFFTDPQDYVIRMIDSSGIIKTFAGTGTPGYSGDGGAATSAQLNSPEGIAFDASSASLYFWDDGNYRVRRIDSCGIISTVAGTGAFGYSGDGGPATLAQFEDAEGLAFCGGNLYLSDWASDTVRTINACGIVQTIGGIHGNPGNTGDNGPFSNATVYFAEGMAFDGSGDLFIGEVGGGTIREVAPDCSPTQTPSCALVPTATPACTQPITSPTPTATITLTPTVTSTPTVTLSPTYSTTPTATCAMNLWPVPFNPRTAVLGTLKFSCVPPDAAISIFTISGERVIQIPASGDPVQWNGRNNEGREVAPGVYFFVVQAGNRILNRGKFLVSQP